MKTLALNKDNFEKVTVDPNQPVLVDFWAEWCGPCKMFNPVLDALAVEHESKARIGKVNIDESPELAAQFKVTAIPTILVFKGGKVVERFQGVQSHATLTRSLAQAVA